MSVLQHRVWSYTRETAAWFFRSSAVWGSLGVLFFSALTFVHGPGDPEARTRWLGMTWQALGMLFVLRGLVGKHRLFNIPSIRDQLRGWRSERPPWTREHRVAVGSLAMGVQMGRMGGRVGAPPIDEAMPLPERVRRLEEWRIVTTDNLNNLRDSVADAREALARETETLRGALVEEAEKIRRELREAVAADLTLEWVGLLFLVLGMVATSVSDEAHDWSCTLFAIFRWRLTGCG